MTTISTSALARRIKRRLAHRGESISYGQDPWSPRKTWRHVVGGVATVAVEDLDALGRELGVLALDETVSS